MDALTSDTDVGVPMESDSVTSLSSFRLVLTKRRCDAKAVQLLVDLAVAGLKVTVIEFFQAGCLTM
jgi:hypothetical protein